MISRVIMVVGDLDGVCDCERPELGVAEAASVRVPEGEGLWEARLAEGTRDTVAPDELLADTLAEALNEVETESEGQAVVLALALAESVAGEAELEALSLAEGLLWLGEAVVDMVRLTVPQNVGEPVGEDLAVAVNCEAEAVPLMMEGVEEVEPVEQGVAWAEGVKGEGEELRLAQEALTLGEGEGLPVPVLQGEGETEGGALRLPGEEAVADMDAQLAVAQADAVADRVIHDAVALGVSERLPVPVLQAEDEAVLLAVRVSGLVVALLVPEGHSVEDCVGEGLPVPVPQAEEETERVLVRVPEGVAVWVAEKVFVTVPVGEALVLAE
jgi:hypothetical protein